MSKRGYKVFGFDWMSRLSLEAFLINPTYATYSTHFILSDVNNIALFLILDFRRVPNIVNFL